ncbi:SDR family NAD(P)-dependent oxidoreductase, partial [Pseudomonas aeruginosa]|nr:SDR family NAD(P)-dependent oxidoreductase [Pseudomonas aeruginosa]
LSPRLAPRWLVRRLAARINASAVPSVPRG